MLIMQEPLITQESVSGRSWTSKVFNTVISLDTYQFVVFEFGHEYIDEIGAGLVGCLLCAPEYLSHQQGCGSSPDPV